MEAGEFDSDDQALTDRIGQEVRRLRRQRGWSQEQLAEQLHVSQATLSRVEHGRGSLSAEQFLRFLRLFNVDADLFAPTDADRGLQNALARFGATHLREHADAGVPARYGTPRDTVRAVLLAPTSERWVTALAPVLVVSADALPLAALLHDLDAAGLPNRLGWLVENTAAALRQLAADAHREWRARLARAEVILTSFLARVAPAQGSRRTPGEGEPLDVFDPGIRSNQSLAQVWRDASPISRRWSVGSALQPGDFLRALEAAIGSN